MTKITTIFEMEAREMLASSNLHWNIEIGADSVKVIHYDLDGLVLDKYMTNLYEDENWHLIPNRDEIDQNEVYPRGLRVRDKFLEAGWEIDSEQSLFEDIYIIDSDSPVWEEFKRSVLRKDKIDTFLKRK